MEEVKLWAVSTWASEGSMSAWIVRGTCEQAKEYLIDLINSEVYETTQYGKEPERLATEEDILDYAGDFGASWDFPNYYVEYYMAACEVKELPVKLYEREGE